MVSTESFYCYFCVYCIIIINGRNIIDFYNLWFLISIRQHDVKIHIRTFKSSPWKFGLVLVETQLKSTCSKSAIEILEKGVKYV